MSLQLNDQQKHFELLSPAIEVEQKRPIRVLIPYDGSESAEAALVDLRKSGLPQTPDVNIAVTSVWLPLSPYEITRAVSARRMRVLLAGASSFAPALRDSEEHRILSLEAERRIRSIFPSGTFTAEALQDMAAVGNEILRIAKKWKADLIVVGAKISPSPDIIDYAGPALKIAEEAHCSVRIARPSNLPDDSQIRMIIGFDASEAATQTVQSVARRLWPQGSEAYLIAIRKRGPRDPKMVSQMMLAVEQSADELRAAGLRVSTGFRDGEPQDVLLQEAREWAADCIFIHPHGLEPTLNGGLGRRSLGRAAVALILGAHCSIEVVRPQGLIDRYLKPAA